MRTLALFTLLLLTSAHFAPETFAQVMQEKNYMLELESFSERPTPTPIPVSKPVEKNLTPVTNPVPVYPQNQESLNLSVLPGVIDFGIVHATTPVDRNIEAVSTTLPDFFLYAYVTSQLKSEANEIPQTSCDNGSCSLSVAGDWNSTLSFGLGYSCASIGCDRDFLEGGFRPFSLIPTAFASPKKDEDNFKSTSMPLRLNVASTQAPGKYENNIVILAIPKL